MHTDDFFPARSKTDNIGILRKLQSKYFNEKDVKKGAARAPLPYATSTEYIGTKDPVDFDPCGRIGIDLAYPMYKYRINTAQTFVRMVNAVEKINADSKFSVLAN